MNDRLRGPHLLPLEAVEVVHGALRVSGGGDGAIVVPQNMQSLGWRRSNNSLNLPHQGCRK